MKLNNPRENCVQNGVKQAEIAKLDVARQQQRPKEFQRFFIKIVIVQIPFDEISRNFVCIVV